MSDASSLIWGATNGLRLVSTFGLPVPSERLWGPPVPAASLRKLRAAPKVTPLFHPLRLVSPGFPWWPSCFVSVLPTIEASHSQATPLRKAWEPQTAYGLVAASRFPPL